MKKLLLILILIPSVTQGQFSIGTRRRVASSGPPPTGPFISAFGCTQLGASSPSDTTAIDTTGSKIIVVSVGWYQAAGPVTVTDNKGNGVPTELTTYSLTGFQSSSLFYWLIPTVGPGHIFTISASSSYYASACVQAISNVTGVFDSGTDSGTSVNGSTCVVPAVNPGAGAHMLISAVSGNPSVSATIDSGFSIDSQVSGGGGVAFSLAAAHLVQNPGASISPTWGVNGSPASCSAEIASFH